MDEVQGFVIDNGSHKMKAGFAGDDAPRAVFHSIIGHPKKETVMAAKALKDTYIGDEAQMYRDILNIKYPIEYGLVTNWDYMEKLWHHLFYNEMIVDPEDHPILLSEWSFTPKINREKTIQIMFETFNTPAVYLASQAVLALYASGRTSGVMVDSGEGATSVVPVYEGYSIRHATHKFLVAGQDLTSYLRNTLVQWGYRSLSHDTVRLIKEHLCYVAMDFHRELDSAPMCSSSERGYKLPDGNVVKLGNERFKTAEAMLHPFVIGVEFPGLHKVLEGSLNKANLDASDYDTMCQNIVLSGGNTMFSGLRERLQHEVTRLRGCGGNVNVVAPPERKCSAWIGGSILASLDYFSQMWIGKEEYDEFGPSIVHKKCFS